MYRNERNGYRGQSPPSSSRNSAGRNNDNHRMHREYEPSEQDTQQILSEAKQIRNQSLDVSRDAVYRLRQTEESAQRSLVMLDSQSEKLLKAQSDLNLAQ